MLKLIISSKLSEKPEPWGSSKTLFKSDKTKSEIGLFKCSSGMSMDMHKHEFDELIYVLSGKAIFEDEGGSKEGEEGSAVFIPRNIAHRTINRSQNDCWCVYVVSNLE
jgi:quercetin dioxygenase-like cupin family protein